MASLVAVVAAFAVTGPVKDYAVLPMLLMILPSVLLIVAWQKEG
jgi:hypothetical protein